MSDILLVGGVETSCMKCNLRPAAPFTVSKVHCMDIIGAGWPRSLYGDRKKLSQLS